MVERNDSDHRRLIALIILCVLLAGIVGLPTLTYRFGRDQAMFAYVGDQWLEGYIPYRDSWDNKPPATYALHALAIAAFGHSQLSARVADLILTLCIVVCIFLLTRAMAGRLAACVAAIGYSLAYYLHFDCWHTAQAEVPTSLFSLLGLIAAWQWMKGSRRPFTAAIAGACVGLATLFKLTGALTLPVIFAMMIWSRKGRGVWPHVVAPSMMVAGGFILPLGVAVAYFAAQDSLLHMWDVVIRFNMEYASQRMESTSLWVVASALAQAGRGMAVVVPLAVVGLLGACLKMDRTHRRFILAWFGASILMVFSQHRFFWYHWLALLPTLSVLAGIGAVTIVAGIAGRDNKHSKTGYWVAIATAVAITMTVTTPGAIATSYKNAIALWMNRISIREFEASFREGLGYRYEYAQAAAVAAYLHQKTSPSETIAVWGFEPEIQFLARRKAPSRFVATHPLFDPDLRYKQHEWRQQFLADCIAAPPAYFVTIQNPARPTRGPAELAAFPDVRRFVEERYILEDRIGQFKMYRRGD